MLGTYVTGTSLVHRFDARLKILLLLVASISVFLVTSWMALGIIALVVVTSLFCARIPISRIVILSLPVAFILFLVIVANSFSFNVSHVVSQESLQGLAAVSSGFMSGWQPVALVGTFGFVPEGCMRGLFYACRVLIILVASFVVTFTTTSNELCDAFVSFLKPLRVMYFPVDDTAMVLSIALRFIPLMADEFIRIRNAQVSRGAGYEQGSLFHRVLSWQTVLIPLVVSMFRRADSLSQAMDARCYGATARTSLNKQALRASEIAFFLSAVVGIIALDVVF